MFAIGVRSYFSLMKATASPLALCTKAVELGYSHLALTDWENLYGLPAFLRACKETGIHPIIGADIGVGIDVDESGSADDGAIYITCLVQTATGYSNLCRLISRKKCDPHFSWKTLPPELGEGLICLISDISLLDMLASRGFTVAANLGNKPTNEGRTLRGWAKDHGVLAVSSLGAAIISEQDQLLYKLLRSIDTKTSLSDCHDGPVVQPLQDYKTIEKRFSMWPEVVPATGQLGNSCIFRGPDFGILMPPWQDDDGGLPTEVLRRDAYRGACLRYGDDLGEVVVERLEHELKIIDDMGFSSYFLVVRDIVHPVDSNGRRKKRRICGRGSGAASLVAYCLEITNVCPVRHNLYFERFLNPGRQDPPDIDIDFAWDERDEVLAEVLGKFSGYAAMVCNHVYFQPKMAIRETAKSFGIPAGEISALTKKLHRMSKGVAGGLEGQIATSVSCREADLSAPWPEILLLATRLIGIPRYLSVHPGGVIITPEKIESYVPIEMANKGVPIIHWEKDGAEELGFIKIDILGNRSLGVIRDTIENLRENGGEVEEREWLPETDPKTCISVAKGRTMGCFYIESPAMRLLQQKAGTGDFEQLVLQSSIIRPAANDFVREYVRRLRGGSWEHLHPILAGVLDETYGLMVYQEDVSKVAVALAGFSHARADGLRKVLSKKDRELRLKDYKEEFYSGCEGREIEEEVVHKLWAMILSFDGYSFCKPHSASYAKVSYQSAYLKRHFPAEFMAAVISNGGGFYSIFGYVSEAKRMGLKVLLPDVQKSQRLWCGKEGSLLTGFLFIKGLSCTTIERLLLERSKSLFTDISDFLHRVRPSVDEGRALILCGALDSLEPQSSREELLWSHASFRKLISNKKNMLFSAPIPKPPKLSEHSPTNRLRYEYQILGFLAETHPLSLLREKTSGTVKALDLQKYIGCHVRLAGWLLTGKIVSTKTGEAMEFLSFEDETASYETTFFPRVYRKYAHILEAERGYIMRGVVDEDYGAITVTVHEIYRL